MKQNEKDKLVRALQKIVLSKYDQIVIKKSGNLLNLLRSIEEEDAVKIADLSYLKKTKEREVFPLGLNFGHFFKNKNSFYRIELRDNILYFEGTESEIIKKVREKIDGLKTNEDEKEE